MTHPSPLARAILIGALMAVGCQTVPPLPPAARELNEAGVRALVAGEVGDAEAQLALATEYSPEFTEAWANLGMLELSRGNFDLAKKHLERAKDINEHLPVPHHGLGLIAERRNRLDDAMDDYRQALKVDPGFVPARVNLANLLFRTARHELARVEFQKLTLHRPREAAGWVGYIETLLRLGRVIEAAAALANAEKSLASHPEIRMLRARRHIANGNLDEAQAILESLAITDDAATASRAHAFLAVVHFTRGDKVRARTALDEARSLDPSSVIASRLALTIR